MDATYEYAVAMYDALVENSKMEQIDDVTMRVFEGGLVDLFKNLGVSQSYYGPINNVLRDLGCVTVIRRGSRGWASLLALHHPPDEAEFILWQTQGLTNSPEAAKLRERLTRLETRLGGMNIVEALEGFERRLERLERETGITDSPSNQIQHTGE